MRDPDFSQPWQKRGVNVGGRKLPPARATRRVLPTADELPTVPPPAPVIPPPVVAKAKVTTQKIDVTPEQFDRLREAAAADGITLEALIEQLIAKGETM